MSLDHLVGSDTCLLFYILRLQVRYLHLPSPVCQQSSNGQCCRSFRPYSLWKSMSIFLSLAQILALCVWWLILPLHKQVRYCLVEVAWEFFPPFHFPKALSGAGIQVTVSLCFLEILRSCETLQPIKVILFNKPLSYFGLNIQWWQLCEIQLKCWCPQISLYFVLAVGQVGRN